jgi:hypothetical protein
MQELAANLQGLVSKIFASKDQQVEQKTQGSIREWLTSAAD